MNIVKDGVLSFKDVFVKKLPKNFKTHMNLDLSDSTIETLENGIMVGGDLILNNYITEIPKEIFVGGNLIVNNKIKEIPISSNICGHIIGGDNVKYLKYKPSPKTVYNNFVCCDDGTIVPYTRFYIKKRIVHNEKYFFDRKPITFYYGLKPNLSAATFDNGRIFVWGKSFKECEQKIEKILLEERKELFNPFENWTIFDLHSVDELKDFFILSTNACEIGCDDFITQYAENKKYSLEDLKNTVLKYASNFPYLYLFMDKYNEFEKKTFNLITLSKKKL